MTSNKEEWWTHKRVEATVTSHYVYSHLRTDEAEQLSRRVFATFSDDTYLQWILRKTKRLFLILVDANIPGQIFRLIKESYDDEDLPFTENDIQTLRLSQPPSTNIDQVFFSSQFRYILRVVGEDEHIRYAKAETVAVQQVQQKSLNLKDASDHVKLPTGVNRVLLRKRIQLNEDRDELDFLSEVARAKPLKHEHILSIFGSFLQGGEISVLMYPAPTYCLKTFLNDIPKAFAALPKMERRHHLFTWTSCLSNALAWLHVQDRHHGAIRPSRIFIDDHFQPSLGYLEGSGVLESTTRRDDLESYQYSAPELWKRELTVQGSFVSGSLVPQVERTLSTSHAPRPHSRTRCDVDIAELGDMSEEADPAGGMTHAFMPTAKGNSSHLKLEMVNRRFSVLAPPARDADSRLSSQAAALRDVHQNIYQRFDTFSTRSSNSSDNGKRNGAPRSALVYSIPAETKSAVVQTWKSTARNPLAADVFALAAVIMDILTVFCGRTSSAFAKHRASRHRQAGRGGGLADASFHANLMLVVSWAENLNKDSEKKMKKGEGSIFRAVGPTLQVVLQCLDREPEKRMEASSLAKRINQYHKDFANASDMHCTLRLPERTKRSTRQASQIGKYSRSHVSEIEQQSKLVTSLSFRSSKKHESRPVVRQYEGNPYASELIGFPQPASSSNREGDADPGSATTVDYYDPEDHSDYGPHPGTRWDNDKNFTASPPRPGERKVRLAHLEDDFEVMSPPPSLVSRTTGTSGTSGTNPLNYDGLEPNTPGSTNYSTFPGYSPSSHPPPDRDLPPIPQALKSTNQTTRVVDTRRRRAPPSLTDVGHATHMLAEAVKGTNEYSNRSGRTSPRSLQMRPNQNKEDGEDIHYIYSLETRKNVPRRLVIGRNTH